MPLAEYRRSGTIDQVGVVRFNEAGQGARHLADGLNDVAKLSEQMVADAETRYILDFEQSQRQKAAELARNFPVDSEKFKSNYADATKADLATVPWYHRERARAVQQRIGADHYVSIVKQEAENTRNNARISHGQALNQFLADLAAARRRSDRQKIEALITQYEAHVKLGEDQRFYAPESAQLFRRRGREAGGMNTLPGSSPKPGTTAPPHAAAGLETTPATSPQDLTSDASPGREGVSDEPSAIERASAGPSIAERSLEQLRKLTQQGTALDLPALANDAEKAEPLGLDDAASTARWAARNSATIEEFARLSAPEQERQLDRQAGGAGQRKASREAHVLRQVVALSRLAYRRDPFAASLARLADDVPRFEPLGAIDAGFAARAGERLGAADAASDLAVTRVVPAFADEKRRIMRDLEAAPIEEKAEKMAVVDRAFGRYAVAFWREMADPSKGQGGAAANTLGRAALLAPVDPPLARRVLEGQAAIRTTPGLMPIGVSDIRRELLSRFGDSSVGRRAFDGIAKDVALLYAAEAVEFGATGKAIDASLLESALLRRAGQAVRLNGGRALPPVAGWSLPQLRTFIDGLESRDFEGHSVFPRRAVRPVLATTMRPVPESELKSKAQLRAHDLGIYRFTLHGETLIDAETAEPIAFDFYRLVHEGRVVL
jgi:hypothetical protein